MMLGSQHVASSILLFIVLAEKFIVTYSQFLNGPSRIPQDTIKDFRNIPRFPGNAAIGNFQRSNLNYVQQNSLRFQQIDPKVFDRRDTEASDSDRGNTGGNIDLSQYDNSGFCRDGWSEANVNGVPICIRVNTEPSSWDDAQENCRKEYSFLLKIEVPIKVQSKSIEDHLLSLGIKNVWTGLHSEHQHLVWDNISPILINGKSGSERSPWSWDQNFADDLDELCGEIDIQDNSHIIQTRRRKKRATDDRRKLLEQFQNFFPQATPPNSKEVVENSPSKDLGQVNFADRLRMMNNQRQIVNFAGMSQQRQLPNMQQSSQMINGQLQYNDSPKNPLDNKDISKHDFHLNGSPSNVRPLDNQRFLTLLNMLRSGSILPSKESPTKQPKNGLSVMSDYNNKVVTIAPTDEIDNPVEQLQKIGELFNKEKIISKTDDDDKHLKLETITPEMATSFKIQSEKIMKNDDHSPTVETVFNNQDKVTDIDIKPTLKTEKSDKKIGTVFENLFSDDRSKIESENSNNPANINLQQTILNNMNNNLPKPDDTKNIQTQPEPTFIGKPINIIPTLDKDKSEGFDESDNQKVQKSDRAKAVHEKMLLNMQHMLQIIPSAALPHAAIGDQGIQVKKEDVQEDALKIDDKSKTSKGVFLLKQLDNIPKLEIKPSDVNIGKGISERDEIKSIKKDSPVNSGAETKSIQDLNNRLNLSNPSNDQLSDDKNEDGNKIVKIQANIGSNGPIPIEIINSDSTNTETKRTSIHREDKDKDDNDMLLKLLEGMESNVDLDLNNDTSIQLLKRKLESKLQLPNNENLQTTTQKTIEAVTPKTDENDDINLNNKHENKVSVGGILIPPFEIESTTILVPKSNETKTESTISTNLSGKIIDENFGGNVENILKILEKISEKKPVVETESDVLSGSIIQQMVTNDREGTSIHLTIPNKVEQKEYENKTSALKETNDDSDEVKSSDTSLTKSDENDKILLVQTPSLNENESLKRNNEINVKRTPGGITIGVNAENENEGAILDTRGLKDDIKAPIKNDKAPFINKAEDHNDHVIGKQHPLILETGASFVQDSMTKGNDYVLAAEKSQLIASPSIAIERANVISAESTPKDTTNTDSFISLKKSNDTGITSVIFKEADDSTEEQPLSLVMDDSVNVSAQVSELKNTIKPLPSDATLISVNNVAILEDSLLKKETQLNVDDSAELSNDDNVLANESSPKQPDNSSKSKHSESIDNETKQWDKLIIQNKDMDRSTDIPKSYDRESDDEISSKEVASELDIKTSKADNKNVSGVPINVSAVPVKLPEFEDERPLFNNDFISKVTKPNLNISEDEHNSVEEDISENNETVKQNINNVTNDEVDELMDSDNNDTGSQKENILNDKSEIKLGKEGEEVVLAGVENLSSSGKEVLEDIRDNLTSTEEKRTDDALLSEGDARTKTFLTDDLDSRKQNISTNVSYHEELADNSDETYEIKLKDDKVSFSDNYVYMLNDVSDSNETDGIENIRSDEDLSDVSLDAYDVINNQEQTDITEMSSNTSDSTLSDETDSNETNSIEIENSDNHDVITRFSKYASSEINETQNTLLTANVQHDTNILENEIISSDDNMDMLLDTSNDVDMVDDVDEEYEELSDTQFNDTSELVADFDTVADESENVGKEILSEELSEDIGRSGIIVNKSDEKESKSTDIVISSAITSVESFENATETIISSNDILVSEAASQDDTVRQSEFRDLDTTQTADDLLEEEAEEFVPPEDIIEPIPHSSQMQAKSITNQKKLIMRLGGCDKPKPSVCFSQPIKVYTDVSMCGTGWFGNVFVDKCYRYIPQAMTFTFARDMCSQVGGQLAVGDSVFLRRFILTSVTLARFKSNLQNNVISVWIHTDASSNTCRLLSNSIGVHNVNCQTIAEAVCEKPKQQISSLQTLDNTDNHGFDYVQPEVKQFSMNDLNNKLQCSLTNVAPELPVIWYKDGVPLATKITRPSSLMSNSPTVISQTTELFLTQNLTSVFSSNNTSMTEMLQGRYWCESWNIHPFKRVESKPTLVRFSDVMTFVGRLNMQPITVYDYTLYNMINEQTKEILSIVNDLQVLHNSILPELKAEIPEVQKILIKPDFLERKPTQSLKFYTYVVMSTTYTMATERSVRLLMKRELRETLHNTTFVLSLPGKTPLHHVRSMTFNSTVACPMERLKDKETSLVATFPNSAIDFEVNSVETCDGAFAGKAKCVGDYENGAYWTDVRVFKTCNSNSDNNDDNDDSDTTEENDASTVMGHISVQDRLKELSEVEVEDGNVDAVMDETADILEKAKDMTAEYVDFVAEIVAKTAKVDRTTLERSEKVVKTIDKILDIDDEELKKSKKANSIILNLERVAEQMTLDVYGQFRIVTPNVALEVWDLKHQSLPVIGLAAKEDHKTEIFEESQIVTLFNRSQVYLDDVNAAIELPPELVHEVMLDKESRLYMMVYRHGRLFKTMSEAQTRLKENKEAKFVDDSGLLNSFVISASIGGKKIENLKSKVKAIFKPLKDVKGKEKTCAHWDFTLNNNRGGWSAKGCVYNGTVNGRDICLCDHLTNFAVLIDFYGQAVPIPEDHEISLSIISLIGLSLSILGLSLTIISYAFFKKLRRGRAQQTLFNLALTMLCSWIVFLTGIKQTHSYYGCIIVAALLHYFILSSFMWMLMEAFLQYLTFVKVLGTYVTRYTLKTVLIAWGLPLIPVISVMSVDYTLYSGGSRYCWMSLTAFYYSFAVPVGLIIICNIIVFVVTVISIFKRPTGLRSNQSKSKMAMANLQAAITSFVLLGLTWFLGYLAISDARLPFQYAFTILNSLQGFFIFVLFVLRKKRVRDQWLILCCCKNQEQEKVLRSLSASGSIPSTGSGRSSYSGRSERSDSTRTTTSFVNDSYDSLFFPFKSSRSSLYYREKSNSISSE